MGYPLHRSLLYDAPTPDFESLGGPPILFGRSDGHLCSEDVARRFGARMHREVVGDFDRLRTDAASAGFDLRILSGFRDFERQLSIWNRKARGELAVLDSEARPLDIGALSDREHVYAILRWSALPGGSRHHWGTDLDVFDERARPSDYEVDLVPEEVAPEGMFGPFHGWLDERMAEGRAHGFFRPYDVDRGGVAPERWHLSHGPTAAEFEREFTPGTLHATLSAADMALKDTVFRHFDDIYERFVINTSRNPF